MWKRHLTKFDILFVIKTSNELVIGRMYFDIIKGIYDRPINNNLLSREKLKASLKSGTRWGCSLSPLMLNTVLEILAGHLGKKKE